VFTSQVETKSFVTTFVMDNDIVPRLSRQSIAALRDEILELLSRISTPKYQVLAGRGKLSLHPLAGTKLAQKLADYQKVKAKVTGMSEGQREEAAEETDDVETGVSKNDDNNSEHAHETLELPGRVIHLIRTDYARNPASSNDLYAAKDFIPVWADQGDFNAIPMTKSMVGDHGTSGYYQTLENLAEEFKVKGAAYTVEGHRRGRTTTSKNNNKNVAKTSTSIGVGSY
jgi:hypothetical protein